MGVRPGRVGKGRAGDAVHYSRHRSRRELDVRVALQKHLMQAVTLTTPPTMGRREKV